MSLYDSITKSLNEAIEYEKGNLKGVRRRFIKIAPLPHYKGKEIKEIREKLHLTQMLFADICGVSKKTVEAWENGKNTPQGPAQRMIELLNKNNKIVEEYILDALSPVT
ncbi:MAG TPA: helix-turn-helix domain-containing protein [Candidatus Eremiobacteraeota bacterium]|nr:MAG: Antitoxin igA-2 [bacterium ADurb.Bin363]HPZ07184.1 helix-turn-helix domain-containing protein [Candidatus Eremiobacteraeota bacterium]